MNQLPKDVQYIINDYLYDCASKEVLNEITQKTKQINKMFDDSSYGPEDMYKITVAERVIGYTICKTSAQEWIYISTLFPIFNDEETKRLITKRMFLKYGIQEDYMSDVYKLKNCSNKDQILNKP